MNPYSQYRTPVNDVFNSMPLGIGLAFLSGNELRAYNHPTIANIFDTATKILDPKQQATAQAVSQPANNSYMNAWNPKRIQQQAIMNLAQVQPQSAQPQQLPQPPKPQQVQTGQQPQSPLQNIIAKANSGNTQGALEAAHNYDRIQQSAPQQPTQQGQSAQPQYTPLPPQMTGNQIDQLYKSGAHWTPEQEQALSIYSRTQNKEIQDPYKEGSLGYIINNLQGHGYNPQQIADYIQAQSRGYQQQQQQPSYQNPYTNLLNERLRELSSDIYHARNSLNYDRADMLQEQYNQLLGIALQQGQQAVTNAQYGKLTEADKAKLDSAENIQLNKNPYNFDQQLQIELAKKGIYKGADGNYAQAPTASNAKAAVNNSANLTLLNQRMLALKSAIDSPDMPNPDSGIEGWVHTGIRRAYKPNTTEASFQSQIEALKLLIPQLLDGTGKRISNQEINAIQASLPTLNDSKENKQAKFNSVYSQLVSKYGMENGASLPPPSANNLYGAAQGFSDPLEDELKRRGLI